MPETEPLHHRQLERTAAAHALLRHLLATCRMEFVWLGYMLSADKPVREYIWYKDWLSLANEARRADGEEELYEDVTLAHVLLLFEQGQDGLERGVFRNLFWALIEMADGLADTYKNDDI